MKIQACLHQRQSEEKREREVVKIGVRIKKNPGCGEKVGYDHFGWLWVCWGVLKRREEGSKYRCGWE